MSAIIVDVAYILILTVIHWNPAIMLNKPVIFIKVTSYAGENMILALIKINMQHPAFICDLQADIVTWFLCIKTGLEI